MNELKSSKVGTSRRYLCKICNKLTLKNILLQCKGMCTDCYNEEDIYQVFDNGNYQKLEIKNLWDYLLEDNKLYGLFLMINKNHDSISVAKINGGIGDDFEFLETDVFPEHIKVIYKILKDKKRLTGETEQ